MQRNFIFNGMYEKENKIFANIIAPELFNRDNKRSIYLLLTEEGSLNSLPSGDFIEQQFEIFLKSK